MQEANISAPEENGEAGHRAHRHRHVAEPPPSFAPFVIPLVDCKVVTLIRHAQGYHNAAGERDRDAYKSEDYRDAHLTARGWRQALRAGEHWRSVYASGKLPRPDLVVASPLTRTLETASAIFGDELERGDDVELERGGDGNELERCGDESETLRRKRNRRLLMRPRPAVAGRVAEAPFRRGCLYADLPFVAHELCREETGAHPCDERRRRSESEAAFPGVDFSLVEHDDDELYSRQPPGQRETKESVMARASEFARWLLSRPERHVAVVSHAGFLHFFARAVGPPHLPFPRQLHGESMTSQLARWFDNAESRVVVLADASGGASGGSGVVPRPEDPLSFAGGGFEELEEEKKELEEEEAREDDEREEEEAREDDEQGEAAAGV